MVEAERARHTILEAMDTCIATTPAFELPSAWENGYEWAMKLLPDTSPLKLTGHQQYPQPFPQATSQSSFGLETMMENIRSELESKAAWGAEGAQFLRDQFVYAQAYILTAQMLYAAGWHLEDPSGSLSRPKCWSLVPVEGYEAPWC